MSFFGKLFGSESVIKKAAEGVYNGVNYAFHTDQEKAEHFLKLLKAYEPFKLAQRFLALIIAVPFVVIWTLCALMIVVSALMEPSLSEAVCRSSAVLESARLLADWNNETLGEPLSVVLFFYFCGGAAEGAIRAKAGK
ncbi:hypothetical protein [Candidatus Sororendozoicomonas aggregata]|uniref:hypothetical protein n=1 Tax=Candidatus Sororendozoicomonas aggregata TaxID=3073239 RepID=UPI002ED1E6D9